VEIIGLTNESGIVSVQVTALPDTLDAAATIFMRTWWADRFRALVRRAVIKLL
jgi:hypothetical protein